MRRINLPFAALLFVATAASAGGFHLLHVYQHGRIAQSLLWQVQKCRDDGQTDQAIKFAGQYLDFRPGDVQVLRDLATWLAGRAKDYKQWNGVANAYEKVLRITPDDAETRLKAADLYARLHRFAEALGHLTKLRESRPDDAKLLTLAGYCQSAVGKHDAAAESYRAAIKAAPQEAAAYVYLAALLQSHFNRPDAEVLATLDAALKANPQSALAHAGRAQFLRRQNKFADAAREIDLARSLGKNDWDVLLAAAEIAQASGELKKARELLDEGAKLYPNNVRFACSLAWLQLHEGRGELAVATLRAAQKVNPKDLDVLTLLADILSREGQVEPLKDALKQLASQKATADRGQHAERVQYVEARLAMCRGRWAEAAARFEQLRSAASRSPALYRQTNHLLAQCYERLGDANGELTTYRRMLEGEPNSHAVRLDYAEALARAGRNDDALREFLAALRPEASPRGVAETTRFLCERFAGDARSRADLERAVDSLKLDDVNPNPTLAKAELDRARRKPGDSLAQVVRVLNKKPEVVALHAARIRLVEQQYGVDRAVAALEEAERYLGDAVEFRVQRARLTARRGDKSASARLFSLAQNLDRFSADDRVRILRELVAASRLLGRAEDATRYTTLLAERRQDDLPAREALALAALKAGNEPRRQALLAEIEVIEGPAGASRLTHEAAAALAKAENDPTQLAAATAKLDAAAKLRPNDPFVEFLRGRADEVAGRGDVARTHYGNAFRAGLLDKPPVEELLACVAGPTAVVREALAESLQPERHPTAVLAALPLYDAAGRDALAARFAAAVPADDAVRTAALGRLFARFGLNSQAEAMYRRAAKAAPQSNDGWLALVTEHARRGDKASLERILTDVRAALPAIQAHLLIGLGYEAANRPDDARREYEQVLVLKPDDTRALRQLAGLQMQAHRPAEAQKTLKALAGQPNDAATADDVRWARRTLAVQLSAVPSLDSYHQAMNLLDANPSPTEEDQRARVIVLSAQKSRPYGEGRTCRQEAIRLLETLQQKGTLRSADDLIQLAKLYRAENDDAKARAARERLKADYGGHYGSLAFLAREAIRDFALPECDRLLPTLRQLGPGKFETVVIEFQCRTLAGEGDRARRLVDEFIKAGDTAAEKRRRARDAADLIFDFTQAYPLAARSDEAKALREFALSCFKTAEAGDIASVSKIATLLARTGQTGQAFSVLFQARGKVPPEAIASGQVAVLRHGQPTPQQTQATKMYLLDEFQKNPRSTSLQLSLAEFYDLTGSQDKAVEHYRDVLVREKDNVVALNNLAWTLAFRRATVQESSALIDRAVDVVGPADELLDTRARIRFEMGRVDAGLRDMAEAAKEAPSAARYADLAKLYERAGKPEQAQQALAMARHFGAP